MVKLRHEAGELSVVRENVLFRDREVPVEDREELALDATNVTFAKDTGAHGPVDVLQATVVGVLRTESDDVFRRQGDESTYFGRNDQGTEEDPLICPLLKGYVEVGASAVEVGEGGKDDRDFDLCASENVVDEGSKRRIMALKGTTPSVTPSGRAAQGGVDGVLDCINEVVCGSEVRDRSSACPVTGLPMTGRVTGCATSSRRAGECVDASTSDAL